MPLVHKCQRTDDWLAARMGKITASLAAACLGLDPHTSRQKAWRTIIGTQEKNENRHMRWGVQFEAAARLDYETETGNMVEETGFWIHPLLPWLGASPDGLIGKDGLAEIKCPTIAPAKVPIHHRIQMLIQLAVTERAWCDYYAWGAGNVSDQDAPRNRLLVRVHRAGIPNLIVKLEEFYRTYVVPGVEPPRKKRASKRLGT